MTLSLELGGIHDPNVRRALEQLSQQFPIVVPPGGGGGGAETDPVASPALATHAALTTGAHGGIVASTDPRLTDARTPTAHKTSHEPGGTDALTGLTNASIAAAAGIAKTKLANLDVVNADVNAAAAIAESKLSLATDAAAGTGSRRTLGTTATSAAAGNRGLPVGGTTGQALTKNSATDYDAGWSTVAAGGGGTQVGAFLAYRNATQSIATSVGAVTFAKVAFNAEVRDISGWFDSTTNNRYTPLTAGLYRLAASVYLQAPVAGTTLAIRLYKNGAFHRQLFRFSGSTVQDIQGSGTAQVQANGTTDFFEIFVAHDAGAAKNVFGDATTPAAYTYFEGELIG